MSGSPMLRWRKSSYSSPSGSCVEIARRFDGRVLLRNANHPDAGTLTVGRTAMAAWVAGCRAGDLDDLTAGAG